MTVRELERRFFALAGAWLVGGGPLFFLVFGLAFGEWIAFAAIGFLFLLFDIAIRRLFKCPRLPS